MEITREDYEQYKPLLFSLGYRMLGSVTETEDVVQETFLKAHQVHEENIRNKKAYLCKICTNLCLDVLKSARHKRAQYVGPWNPEPLLQEKLYALDPSETVIQKEGLSIAYLRMMEHLAADERAVLLLREVLNFPYPDIAEVIDKKEENCRKIFSRAKRKIAAAEGESLHYEKNKLIVNRFIEAFQKENTEALLELISNNAILYSDGGGIVNAAVRPITPASNVLALLYGIMKKAPQDFYFEIKSINHQPAIVLYMHGRLQSVLSFCIRDEQIAEFYITVNPEKLPGFRGIEG
ncbi:RNA polymerase sigma-70 factor [Jeotgalibacillus sp. R-1-5s-1]|uniref:RNA polymerase sigma-70 factor n=1 Tax=Jeotgalibacillus sp. R-1-5s-1 TaxID=2555897 RepID=UPI00106C9776|nr:RNA polymerase sigma-70 factor [Jeotgalibacillus sp. R-1-5s-1]TFD96628.1 RNA polymerase sigma-70 factor [Jeotgalibacillus sp. R-1-5s-1]